MASSYNENTYQAVSTTVPPPSDNIVSVYNEDAYQAEDPLYDEDANQAEDSSHNEDAYQPDDKDPVKTSASPANGIPANTDDSVRPICLNQCPCLSLFTQVLIDDR